MAPFCLGMRGGPGASRGGYDRGDRDGGSREDRDGGRNDDRGRGPPGGLFFFLTVLQELPDNCRKIIN